MFEKLKRAVIGAPRDFTDPKTYHKISLVALMAWVGLGADGLSSSAYGPEEAFKALGQHTYLAIGLALATALTVSIISLAYSRIIEHFPFGGGGYIVASQLLGPRFGVVSGCALLVDYVLTVSVSIASCIDQLYSVVPPSLHGTKLIVEAVLIAALLLLNLRGVKESIAVLAPIFGLFLLTHAILIFGGIFSHAGQAPRVVHEVGSGFHDGLKLLGIFGLLKLFMRAYSMGAGTFTGIEAVSNGLQIMREPRVQTGRMTMLYMSISLAVTASGILLCYLLFGVTHEEGRTMNATLLDLFASGWHIGPFAVGHGFVVLALFSEAALLFVAAQAGFIDGPRVIANMAIDGWLPRRFSHLSDRLTMQDGLLLMGIASLATLLYTHGDTTTLVTMYSINVFLTFSLSELGMCRFWIKERASQSKWKRELAIQSLALAMCLTILATVVVEKFEQGAWITLLITSLLIFTCFMIRGHYRGVQRSICKLDDILDGMPCADGSDGGDGCAPPPALDPHAPTAVMLVGNYSGLGVHQLLQVQRLFPNLFKQYIFVSVGVIDSATMRGVEEVVNTRGRTCAALEKYAALARRLGFAAETRHGIATDPIAEAERICREIRSLYPKSYYFMGRVLFLQEHWYDRFLHNETAYQLQRRLHFDGLDAIVLPVRLMHRAPAGAAPAAAHSPVQPPLTAP